MKINIKHIRQIEKEIYDKVLDTLSTRNVLKSKQDFRKKIEKEILNQIDVEEIVDQAYIAYKKMSREVSRDFSMKDKKSWR